MSTVLLLEQVISPLLSLEKFLSVSSDAQHRESRPAGAGPDVPMAGFIPKCSGVCVLCKTGSRSSMSLSAKVISSDLQLF